MQVSQHKFASKVFFFAAVYGLAVLLPQYFMEQRIGRQFPPPLTHPDQFYGFIGLGVAWQLAFLVIARDVERYRLLMLPAAVEKFSFGTAAVVLYLQSRLAPLVLGFGMLDMVLGMLFITAFRVTRPAEDTH